MKTRIIAGYVAALLFLGGSAAVLDAAAPQTRSLALAQAPPPAGARIPGSRVRPPGVPADHWIRVSAELGIVIVHARDPVLIRPGEPIPRTLTGYLVVRRNGHWWRLLTTSGGSIVPLAVNDRR